MGKTALAASLALLSGCGTIMNFSDKGNGSIYGGVVRDFSETGRLLEHTPSSSSGPFLRACDVALAGSFYTFDVPFSFVADTLTLPVTIPAALSRRDRPETQKNTYKDTYSPILIPNVDAAAPSEAEASKGAIRD
jgi:uncharacterized protein YceK